jgi:hypothetical protein
VSSIILYVFLSRKEIDVQSSAHSASTVSVPLATSDPYFSGSWTLERTPSYRLNLKVCLPVPFLPYEEDSVSCMYQLTLWVRQDHLLHVVWYGAKGNLAQFLLCDLKCMWQFCWIFSIHPSWCFVDSSAPNFRLPEPQVQFGQGRHIDQQSERKKKVRSLIVLVPMAPSQFGRT